MKCSQRPRCEQLPKIHCSWEQALNITKKSYKQKCRKCNSNPNRLRLSETGLHRRPTRRNLCTGLVQPRNLPAFARVCQADSSEPWHETRLPSLLQHVLRQQPTTAIAGPQTIPLTCQPVTATQSNNGPRFFTIRPLIHSGHPTSSKRII
jgi:hypothetical protein